MAWSGRLALSRRRRSPTWPSAPASPGRPSPTPSTTPTCCAPTPSPACRTRSTSSATRPTAPPATCAPAPRHLIGLRFNPAQEGTANAAMDRFVHSLVETSRRGRLPRAAVRGRAPTTRSPGTTTCCAPPPSTRSSSPTPTSATRRPPGSSQRRAPFVAFGRPWDDPDATHPWVDVDGAAGAELATAPPARQGPHPDRLDRLAQGLLHRRGPPLRAGPGPCTTRDLSTTGLASRVEDTVASGREAARGAARRGPARPRSSAPPTPWPWACCTPSPTAASAGRPRHRRRRLRRLPGRPGRARRA